MKLLNCFKNTGIQALVFVCVACSQSLFAADWYVSKDGDDSHRGKKQAPFLTINRAAKAAKAGDTVWVADGVYREKVMITRGGKSDNKRISYRAMGDHVVVAGSEKVDNWQHDEDSGLWKAVLPKSFFGEFNPFATLVRPDTYIEVDETSQGWGWLMYGRRKHRGDVFFNGEGLVEQENRSDLSTAGTWYVDVSPEDRFTVIWANFGDNDPNANSVEVNVRPYAFMATEVGLGYITIEGFTIKNIATSWAPPTAFQQGAITVNGGHHWQITNNNILYSKGLAISVGYPAKADENLRVNAGYHLIENNILLRNGQGGIAGEAWASHSTIKGNIVEDTNYRREFGGWETAAIKFHRLEDVIIADNFIRGVSTHSPGAAHGIWIDFLNKQVHLSNNVVIDAQEDAILFEANWGGPFLIENNILINGKANTMSSQDEVWAHNLLIDVDGHWVDQDYGDRPPVKNARWLNNMLIDSSLAAAPHDRGYIAANNVYLGDAKPTRFDQAPSLSESSVEADYVLNDKEMTLRINMPAQAADYRVEQVTREIAAQPLVRRKGNAFSVDKDMLGNDRKAWTAVGPLAHWQTGPQDIVVYTFPARYAAVKQLQGAGF